MADRITLLDPARTVGNQEFVETSPLPTMLQEDKTILTILKFERSFGWEEMRTQLNLDYCQAVQDLLQNTVRSLRVYLAVISEHYRAKCTWQQATSNCNKVAIWACGKCPLEIVNKRDDRFVRIIVNGIYFLSCNFPLVRHLRTTQAGWIYLSENLRLT